MQAELQRPRLNRDRATPPAEPKGQSAPSSQDERNESKQPHNWLIRRLLKMRIEAEEEARKEYDEHHDDSDSGYTNDIEYLCLRARAKVTTEYIHEALAAAEYAKRNFPGELWLKDDHYPNKISSLLQDRLVAENVKRFPRLWDILNFNDKLSDKTKRDKSQEPIECKTKKGIKEKRYQSYFRVDARYYAKAEKELALKRPTMTKYLQALCKFGFYQRKYIAHSKTLEYKDGMWQIFPNGNWKKLRLFKCNTAGKRALREFCLSYSKGSSY